MADNRAVTVIVPVYNGSAHLAETLASLLAQTHRELEIVVVNDGSSDGSADVVRAIKDSRIRLIDQSNAGLSRALNRGIAEVQTPFVARSDQDDLSVPHRIERQLEILSSRADAVALFSFWSKFGRRRSWSNADKLDHNRPLVTTCNLHTDGCLLASTLCARTDALRAIGGFRQEYYPSDDWDLQLRLTEVGTVLVVAEPLVAYRFHTGANTYRYFTLNQDTTRWAEDSYDRRRRGEPELTFEAFLATEPLTIVGRALRWADDASKLHLRTAGQRYLDGRDFAAAFHAATSCCLNPRDLVSRAATLLSHARAR
jgi:glycosyltransferase involved in cell wall biosynthesis